MAKMDVIGRILLVSIFIIAGSLKFVDLSMYAELLSTSYAKLYAFSHKALGFDLPVPPSFVLLHSKNLIRLTGVLQIIGGFLTILNNKYGCYLIVFLITLFNLVIHNPFIMETEESIIMHSRMATLNLAILGGFLLVAGSNPIWKFCQLLDRLVVNDNRIIDCLTSLVRVYPGFAHYFIESFESKFCSLQHSAHKLLYMYVADSLSFNLSFMREFMGPKLIHMCDCAYRTGEMQLTLALEKLLDIWEAQNRFQREIVEEVRNRMAPLSTDL